MRHTYTVVAQRIQIIGQIWQGLTCAAVKNLADDHLRSLIAAHPEPTRADIRHWLASHKSQLFGDFETIEDFTVDFSLPDGREIQYGWEYPWSETTFSECGGDNV